MPEQTLYWHDYETFGTDPRRDRPVQFAGVRTDYDFNIVGDPLVVYCRPAPDYLPDPDACLITGITPQQAQNQGVCEAEFIRLIHEQIARPNTCTLGYNSLRFDDEVTRNTLYRNLYDPYQREWQNGNSRWDLIDIVRAAEALRPDGVEWPRDADGVPTFRLELLTEANGLEHRSAHNALSDVYATIAVAKRVKHAQPKLYRFLFEHRLKAATHNLLQLGSYTPVVHVSGKYPARKHCLAVVVPICEHPDNCNGVIVYDLSVDPEPLLALSVDAIKERIFTATGDLPEGVDRIPLKTVHVNKCPVLAPINVIRKADAERLEIDLARCNSHLERIKTDAGLAEKIKAVFSSEFDRSETDPDLLLYGGGFFTPQDKAEMAKVHETPPDKLALLQPKFRDKRLPEMFFRYKARNYPDTLNPMEREQWERHCREVMLREDYGCARTLRSFEQRLDELRREYSGDHSILSELGAFAERKRREFEHGLSFKG